MMNENALTQNKSFKVYLGSILLFVHIVISTLIISPLIILAAVLPFSFRYFIAGIWIRLLFWVLENVCGLTYEVEGLENLPKDQTFIVLSKHQSAWETIALRLFLPPQTALLKKSLTYIPFGGWALATLKPIAIDRQNKRESLKALIQQGTARLEEGLVVVIFPEGTRAAPGEDKKFSAGGAMLAHHSGYPVIPLAHNAGEFWPRNSFLKFPGVIKVKIGPAIEVQGKKAKEINAEAEAWIAQAMKQISSDYS